MLTKDDLLAIGELIKTEIKPLKQGQEQIRSEIVTRSELEVNNKVIGTIVRVEISSAKDEIIKAIKDGFQETARQIKQLGQKLDTIEVDHEDRITTLEHEIFGDPRPVKP